MSGSPLYCTDEDLLVRDAGDFTILSKPGALLASAQDGTFDGGTPWLLSSPSIDFEARGVTAGTVVLLGGPKPRFQGSGEVYAVASVAPEGITLRAVGLETGIGQAPGAGGVAGVSFAIRTLRAQIASASLDVDQFLGLNPQYPSSAAPYDPTHQLVQLAALTVLARQYAILCRGGKDSDFAAKLRQVESDLRDARARLSFRPAGETEIVARSIFSTQFRR